MCCLIRLQRPLDWDQDAKTGMARIKNYMLRWKLPVKTEKKKGNVASRTQILEDLATEPVNYKTHMSLNRENCPDTKRNASTVLSISKPKDRRFKKP